MIPFAMMSLSEKDDLDRSRCNCPYSYKKEIFSNNGQIRPSQSAALYAIGPKPRPLPSCYIKICKIPTPVHEPFVFASPQSRGYQAFVCGNRLAMEETHSAFKPDYPSRPIVSSHPAPPQTELPPHTWRGPALPFPPRREYPAAAL